MSSPHSSKSSRRSSPAVRSPAAAMVAPSQNYYIPTHTVDANTGPKGVIADAQSFDRARKRSFRRTLNGLSSALSSNMLGVAERLGAGARPRSRADGADEGASTASNKSDPSDDEDEFLRSWREKRLAEIEEKAGAARQMRRTSPSKRIWAHCLTPVDALGYLDAIERVPRDTMVVVFISDDESSISREVEVLVNDLARKYNFARFIKLAHDEAEMDAAGIPAILAYKNGDLIANLVSVVDEIPATMELNTSSLEAVLHRYRIV